MKPTIDKLNELRLFGMAKALEEQNGSTEYEGLAFLDRLGPARGPRKAPNATASALRDPAQAGPSSA